MCRGMILNHVGVGGVALTVGLVVGVRLVLVEAGTEVVDLSFYEKGNIIFRRNVITEYNCNCLVMRILRYWESLNS